MTPRGALEPADPLPREQASAGQGQNLRRAHARHRRDGGGCRRRLCRPRVLFERSPRHVEVEEARVLAAALAARSRRLPSWSTPTMRSSTGVAERVRPDLLQLHGSETPERVAAIKARTGLPVMKAIRSPRHPTWCRRRPTRESRTTSCSTQSRAGRDAARGHGESFDWAPATRRETAIRAVGRLRPRQCRRRRSRDRRVAGRRVVRRRERAGKKDAQLVRRFIQAAKAPLPHRGPEPHECALRPTAQLLSHRP